MFILKPQIYWIWNFHPVGARSWFNNAAVLQDENPNAAEYGVDPVGDGEECTVN